MKNILCVGTLIADVISQKLEVIPIAGESVDAEVSLCPGGSGYSSSANIKRLVGEDVGVHCYGLVGIDGLGEILEKELKEEGVICHLSRIAGQKTSCNMILQTKEEDRRYIFFEGANSFASSSDVIDVISRVNPDILVLGEMPSLGLVGPSLLEIIRRAKKTESLVCLDALTDENGYECLINDWHLIDVLHCNYTEGRSITKKNNLSEMCYWFLERGVALPVISDGKEGSVYGYKDQTHHLPVFEVEEVDATGAGDAMLAGIISGLIRILDGEGDIRNVDVEKIKRSCIYGSASGAVAVRSFGCVTDISPLKVQELIALREFGDQG
jgi:sugar/nucleoside kinase (ribokinase family)